MKKIFKDRLLKMADFLETQVSPKNFNLREFVTTKDGCSSLPANQKVNLNKPKLDPKNECGYAACAIGWMPAIFPKSFKWFKIFYTANDLLVRRTYIDNNHYDGCDTWTDAKLFLGLSGEPCRRNQLTYLFSDSSYHPSRRGPKSVAARIRQFVNKDGFVPKYKIYEADEDDF